MLVLDSKVIVDLVNITATTFATIGRAEGTDVILVRLIDVGP